MISDASLGAYMGILTRWVRYGIDPMWSKCPWVIRSARICCSIVSRYSIFGMTRSIPGVLYSGNWIPQSMITAS